MVYGLLGFKFLNVLYVRRGFVVVFFVLLGLELPRVNAESRNVKGATWYANVFAKVLAEFTDIKSGAYVKRHCYNTQGGMSEFRSSYICVLLHNVVDMQIRLCLFVLNCLESLKRNVAQLFCGYICDIFNGMRKYFHGFTWNGVDNNVVLVVPPQRLFNMPLANYEA